MNFSSKMIKSKMHEIGIMKALGTQNRSIGVIFGIQVVLIAIITILISTLGYYFLIDVSNGILIESLQELASGNIVYYMDFLTFKFKVAVFNVCLIVFLSFVSLLIPMCKIKMIKPVQIIKVKE